MTGPADHAVPSDPDAAPPARRRVPVIFWLILLSAVGAASAVGLSLWLPHLQRDRAVSRIESMGGRVETATVSSSWSEAMRNLLGDRPAERVVAVDLTAADLPDGSLELLTPFDELRQLSLSGPRITDESLRPLKGMRKLQMLVLIDCPQVSESAERELRTANPALRIARRGPALLGVIGQASSRGCGIVRVQPGTAADRAGIVVGDFVTQINDRAVRSFESLAREIARYQPGDQITVTVSRRGTHLELPVTLRSRARQ